MVAGGGACAALGVFVLFVLPFGGIGAYAAVRALDDQQGPWIWIGPIFLLVALITLIVTLGMMRSARRYGETALELETMPIPIGGELLGRVRIARGVPPGAIAQLTLALDHCV